MGRFYEISLTPAPTDSNPNPAPAKVWSSYPGGTFDPSALNVQLDLLSSYYAVPMGPDVGNSTVTIEGISLSDLQQAAQFGPTPPGPGNPGKPGMQISVKGGMGADGLPLANPNQAGLLLQGQIFQSFGNWVGTEMNLNFVVVNSSYTFTAPGNFVFQWLPGQQLSAALQTCLEIAYPNTPVSITIGNQYSTTSQINWHHYTLKQVAQWLRSYTKKQSPDGQGVNIAPPSSGTIIVSDGTTVPPPIQIVFTDFVGQPKWTNPNIMTFTTVMRADIQVGSTVKMPQGLPNAPGGVETQASSQPSQMKYKTSFQGPFVIQSVRHVGNSRDPDGASWVSIFQAAPQKV